MSIIMFRFPAEEYTKPAAECRKIEYPKPEPSECKK